MLAIIIVEMLTSITFETSSHHHPTRHHTPRHTTVTTHDTRQLQHTIVTPWHHTRRQHSMTPHHITPLLEALALRWPTYQCSYGVVRKCLTGALLAKLRLNFWLWLEFEAMLPFKHLRRRSGTTLAEISVFLWGSAKVFESTLIAKLR